VPYGFTIFVNNIFKNITTNPVLLLYGFTIFVIPNDSVRSLIFVETINKTNPGTPLGVQY